MKNPGMFHTQKDYENPSVTKINRAPDHSPWGAYESAEQAAKGDLNASRFIQSLDGSYAFRLHPTPEAAEDFYQADFDAADFAAIQVPGAWELQGHGQPLYTNVPYPFPKKAGEPNILQAGAEGAVLYDPPQLPKENPTGCYRRVFSVCEEMLTREFFLRFESVEAAFYVWINGRPVGYSEDSRLPAEFNVTKDLVAGENLLCVQVMRFASSTWLEDQDYWYLSGIHGHVSLVAKPRLRLQDVKLTALPNLHNHCGQVTAEVALSRIDGFADCRVRLLVLDNQGASLGTVEGIPATAESFSLKEGPMSGSARLEMNLSGVSLWTPDTPTLYTAVFTLIDGEGRETDFESCRFGFRLIEIQNGILLLNGKRLVVCGVNRHAHALTGRTVDEKHMREEIRQMKRMNINAVRTCHYPQPDRWYALCDELGLLNVCECNIETHGVGGLLSNDPAYAVAYLERAVRMLQIFKNHSCIFSWSLGNESGYGANHAAMYGFVKEYDRTRICQYESASPGKNISDLRGQMYAPIDRILEMLADPDDIRPIVLVEYLYQISNSGGGAYLFRKLTDRYPRFQGGFVWDWADKLLPAVTSDGIPFDAYGGDFGEPFYDDVPFMVANGLVLPDLTWKPVAHELKMAYAPLRVERRDGVWTWNTTPDLHQFVLKNQSFALCSDEFAITAILKENGTAIETVAVKDTRVQAGEEKEFRLEIPHEKKAGCEYHIDFELRRKNSAWFEEKNEITFACQYPLESGGPAACEKQKHMPVSALEEGKRVSIIGDGFTAVFDREKGILTELTRSDGTLVLAGGEPCFARPYTGLDCKENWGWYNETAPLNALAAILKGESLVYSNTEAVLRFDFAYAAAHPLAARVTYRVTARGISVEYAGHARFGWRALPRMGLAFTLPKKLQHIAYLGLGPLENYPDRKAAARLGVYETTVAETHFPFVPPAETGGHEETRWLSLTDAKGCGLRFQGETPFHFDAHFNSISDYRAAKHEHELIRRDTVFLHLDAAHSPIGSHMAWSTDVDENAMLSEGVYYQTFHISLIGK